MTAILSVVIVAGIIDILATLGLIIEKIMEE